jgi:hypothetical protein
VVLATSAGGSQLPFAFGQAFVQGHVPSGQSLAGLQLTRISTWPDGSLKFGIVAGRADMAAASPLTLNLATGTPAAGAALTTADLRATGITASVGAGSFGTADWSGVDWDSPHRTWVSGPLMSSWTFRRPLGSDAHLVAWIEVRLWQGGAVEVLPWIENGYITVAGPSNKSATYTFALGGSQRFSAAIDLPGRCRTPLLAGTALSYWLGADPGVAVSHDRAYLMAAKLVPNYPRAVAASTSYIATAMTNNFSPLSQGLYPNAIGQGGYHESIGLLPSWDASYLACSTSTKPWIELQHQAYRAGRYGIHYRDENTQKPPRLSDHATRVLGRSSNVYSAGSSSTNSYAAAQTGTVPPQWAVSHHPSVGFLAALLTGRLYHVETCQFAASIATLFNSDPLRGQGAGALRLRSYIQVRGFAWALRTLAQAVVVTPDADNLQAEYRGHVTATVDYNHNRYVVGPSNPLGWMDCENPDSTLALPNASYTPGQDPYTHAPWMHDFVVASLGYVRHCIVDIGTNQPKLVAWFNQIAKSVVGRFGGVAADEWLYRDAADYCFSFAPVDGAYQNSTGTLGPFYSNWGQAWDHTWLAPTGGRAAVWSQNFGTSAPRVKELGDGSLRGGGVGNIGNYWANMQPALSYCVEHGVSGAASAWTRYTGAPNFESGIAAFYGQRAEWGVFPRS